MNNNQSRSSKFNQSILFKMGLVWIGLAMFGLIFDPEKKVIIISQIAIGLVCFILFIRLKLKKS